MNQYTIPLMQGTLAKCTKLTLQPNFAKEPFRQSRSNAGVRESSNMINKLIDNLTGTCKATCHNLLPSCPVSSLLSGS